MPVYDAFYGFRGAPFALNPDPRFLFLSRQHREALAGLLYAIADAKGFVLLSGEVGTGKTTVVHTLLAELGAGVCSALVVNPGLSRRSLYRHLLAEFGLPPQRTVLDALHALHGFFAARLGAGARSVLIIDEAHGLADELLEEVRLLSNFETSQSKLLQILLVGQPELVARLDQPGLRQLRQRLAHRFELTPFDFSDTVAYVRSRLATAGCRADLFTGAAYVALHRFSGGVPRLINVLCDNALLSGFARDRVRIGRRLVRRAAHDLGVPAVRRVGAWQRLRAWRGRRFDGHRLPALADLDQRETRSGS